MSVRELNPYSFAEPPSPVSEGSSSRAVDRYWESFHKYATSEEKESFRRRGIVVPPPIDYTKHYDTSPLAFDTLPDNRYKAAPVPPPSDPAKVAADAIKAAAERLKRASELVEKHRLHPCGLKADGTPVCGMTICWNAPKTPGLAFGDHRW